MSRESTNKIDVKKGIASSGFVWTDLIRSDRD